MNGKNYPGQKIRNDWFLVWSTKEKYQWTIELPPAAVQESTESSLEPSESVTLNDSESSTETTPSEASIPSEASTPTKKK